MNGESPNYFSNEPFEKRPAMMIWDAVRMRESEIRMQHEANEPFEKRHSFFK